MKNLWLMRSINITNMVVLVYVVLLTTLASGQQFTAMYVYGDSLVDNGNNNYLNAQAKANFLPYGIDFYQGPTGRFTNGKTIIDFLCELIGIPYIPAFANPFSTDRDIIFGVNYASAAGGVLEESGQGLGQRFSFSKQVENFGMTKRQLQNHMSGQELQQYLEKALAVVILGSNDYVNNYLNPGYPTRSKFKPDKYADIVIHLYSNQISVLYDQGLRRFFLAGVGPIGCTPSHKTAARLPPGKCNDFENDVIQMFNTRLKSLVDQLKVTHQNATFVFGDTFQGLMEILTHPSTYGLTELDRACCGVGRNNAEKMCLPLSIPCLNRDQYAFWDAFHPTQAVHRNLALMAYNGPKNLAYPFNLKQMVLIKP
ncbi:GDSL esterase/lipase At5g08460-like [Amaranthus tricolor]|uniref:GDSL esterase/lipase At5g08460-like n=1 Tax=Amaranthus tricolor TaxID=29722 RepID=UPI00258F6DA6|nr:GDSL esterase/lipase At5g08460-like [Amaranthus tricolor]